MFLFIYFFVSLFFGGFSSHSRIFTHAETSPLPVKATFGPILGTSGH